VNNGNQIAHHFVRNETMSTIGLLKTLCMESGKPLLEKLMAGMIASKYHEGRVNGHDQQLILELAWSKAEQSSARVEFHPAERLTRYLERFTALAKAPVLKDKEHRKAFSKLLEDSDYVCWYAENENTESVLLYPKDVTVQPTTILLISFK
jgi:hypothetical protein